MQEVENSQCRDKVRRRRSVLPPCDAARSMRDDAHHVVVSQGGDEDVGEEDHEEAGE